MTVAITGASGYVGALIAEAVPDGERRAFVRQPKMADDVLWSFEQTIDEMAESLQENNVETLIHAAWDMTSSQRDSVDKTCVAGSRRLLQAARKACVHRVIFISTVSAFDGARSVYGQAKRCIEEDVLASGGIVLRLGLVHDEVDGGMLGALRRSVRRSRLVPMIGSGKSPQYLLPSHMLQRAIERTIVGDFDGARTPLTLADPQRVSFRALLQRLAAEERRAIVPVPLPASLLWFGLRCVEAIGVQLRVRSDSVISFVHYDRAPDFSVSRSFGLVP